MGGIHGLAAASAVLLTLVFLVERFGLQFASMAACGLGVALTAVACLGWRADGDGRWLLWLQALSVLLVATGLLGKPGRFTRTSEWVVMLALYIGARVADWVDHVIFEATGSVSGHTVMHLASAGVAAAMARRVWRSARDSDQPTALSGPSRLSTSFHTTG